MKQIMKAFLSFDHRERSGILLLITLSVIGWTTPSFYEALNPGISVDAREFQAAIFQLDSAAASTDEAFSDLFFFDPNTATLEELRQLGIPESTASTIVRYREKGGHFKKAADLRKIYNLHEADFQRLAPYVRIKREVSITGKEQKAGTAELFYFDPNEATLAELEVLGLSPKTARTLINYRNKGGIFRTPGDLGKIYGMEAELADRLAPFFRLKAVEKGDPAGREAFSVQESSPVTDAVEVALPPKELNIDINQATVEEWQRLYGIGPVLSERIIRFRDKLGGFSGIEQVAETYGLPDSTFREILPHLKASPVLRRMAINDLDWEELAAHPYLNRRQAKGLVNYRQQHGPFRQAEDLKAVLVLPEEAVEKLLPYLSFE